MTTPNQQWREFMAREVRSKAETITGTVITIPILKFFGAGGVSEGYVVDIAFGSNRELRNVPIKMGPGGSYRYAELGQTVKCARQVDGKFSVVAPGDRKISTTVINTYNLGNATPVTTANLGQSFVRRPFSFYQGGLIIPGTPDSGLWTTPGFPKVEKVDGDGDVIP